jgi:hypothetical protein
VHFLDLDGDGHVDMLSAGPKVTQGTATGVDGEVTTSPGPLPTSRLVPADVDGDGMVDVVGTSTSGVLMLLPREPGVWQDLQKSLAGSKGFSSLQGVGSLQASSAVHLLVKHVPPAAPLFLVLGLRAANLPLHGGVLVPAPELVLTGLLADAEGAATLSAHWPAGVPAGTTLFVQAWYLQSGQSFGATNAVVGTSQPSARQR